jgi:DNA-binding NarL/FixJ family response regulator
MIIDSHPVTRLGVKRLLEPAFATEELADGRGALELLTNIGRFDVAIVELRSAAGGAPSGRSTIRSLLQAQPALGVVAHGGRSERHTVREAFDSGATAFVSKHSSPSALLEAVSAVAEQESFIDPAAREGNGSEGPSVTRRQRQVLQLFANGLSTAAIAKRLELSQETVRTHAKASLARLGARDRTHAVAIALRSSLID